MKRNRRGERSLWAFGFAVEQKAAAWLVLEVSARQGLGLLFTVLLPGSVILWNLLGWHIRREGRFLGQLKT